jgi:hypothetical protein
MTRVRLVDRWRRLSGEFENADLAELGTANLSFELREQRQRTPTEKLGLADRVADGLWRAGARLTPEPHGAATPENRLLRGATLVDAFGQWHERELRALRFVVVQRAALAILREDATAWLHNMGAARRAAVLVGIAERRRSSRTAPGIGRCPVRQRA